MNRNNPQHQRPSLGPRRTEFVHEIYMAQFIGQQIMVATGPEDEDRLYGTLIGLDKFAVVVRVDVAKAGEAPLLHDVVVFKHAIELISAESRRRS